MSEQNPLSDKKNKKQKIGDIIGLTLLTALFISFIIGIYLFGIAGIFKLLGIHYTTVWSLIIFVVSYYFLSAIVELFFEAIADLITENMTGNITALLIQFSFQTFVNALCLFIVDAFMDSITLTLEFGMIMALLISIIEIAFAGNKKKQKDLNERRL